jgi:hypothetical protein
MNPLLKPLPWVTLGLFVALAILGGLAWLEAGAWMRDALRVLGLLGLVVAGGRWLEDRLYDLSRFCR